MWALVSLTADGLRHDRVDGFLSIKLSFVKGRYDGYSIQVGQHEQGLARTGLDTESVVVLGSLSTTTS